MDLRTNTKKTCVSRREIGPSAQDLLTILDSIHNTNGVGGAEGYNQIVRNRILTFIIKETFTKAPNIT